MRVWNPDVSFVRTILPAVDITKAGGDADVLAEILSCAFERHNIVFEKIHRPTYGTRQFRARVASACGMPGAETAGDDVVIYVTRKTANLPGVTQEMVDHTCDLVKHEFIHLEQCKASKIGYIGPSSNDDDYFSDPYEIAAIASEIESQLRRLEPDVNILLQYLRRPNRLLMKSDRYKLYLHALREDPIGFRKTFNRMMVAVVARLTQGEAQ